ncbi:MAG: hypothetical protein WAK86_17445 [Pseudonocardiaceae bacterium]
MLDPDADLGRRAWLPCPRCCTDGCSTCTVGTTCDLHCTGGGTTPSSALETTS